MPAYLSPASNALVMGKDLSGMTWDDLLNSINTGNAGSYNSLANGPGFDYGSPVSLTPGSNFFAHTLLGDAQVVTREGANSAGNAIGNIRGREYGGDPYTEINFKDSQYAPEGYMTSLGRNPDGSIGIKYYKEDNGFLGDMAKFIAAAAGMYGGISAASGSMGGAAPGVEAGGEVGTSTAGAGAVDPEYLSAADTAGGLSPKYGSIGTYDSAISGGPSTGLLSSGPSTAGSSASGASDVFGANVAADQLPNETLKLMAQNSAAPGTILDTSLPTVSTSGGLTLNNAVDAAKAASLVNGIVNGGASKVGDQTITSRQTLDPRMDAYLYGANGQPGLLSQIISNGGAAQNAGMKAFGTGVDQYLGNSGLDSLIGAKQSAQNLMDSNISAPQVRAPSQNNLNLSPAYQDMIYGAPGANPYLTGAIQGGINQSNYAFGNYLSDSTKALQDQLAGIRGGSVLNNTMGSSRQGIAEGRALSDYGQNLSRAATQFGQHNTDAAVTAQAGAYDTDRNRALSAMSGLGAQQYGVAQQNAALQAQANALNSQNQIAGTGLSSGLLNQAYGYGTNQDSYGLNRAGTTAGLLSPFTGLNSTATQTQPLYENKAGNIAAGVTAGAGLLNLASKYF